MDDGSFNRLLDWFDSDQDQAGQKYEEIRRKLIKIFASRGCPVAEDLADITIDRVRKKVPELAPNYVGDPALYFFAVGKKVFLEWRRKNSVTLLPPPPAASAEEKEREDQCLQHCLTTLPSPHQDLIVEYYRGEKQAKIDRRKSMAVEMGLSDNALKLKVFRLRAVLFECLQHCLAQTKS